MSVFQAAELSREASIASLKHTRGDVLRALHNELASWRLETGLLDHLVWEYAAFRCDALLATFTVASFWSLMVSAIDRKPPPALCRPTLVDYVFRILLRRRHLYTLD